MILICESNHVVIPRLVEGREKGDGGRGHQLLSVRPEDWPFRHEYESFQAEAESTVSSFVAANAKIPRLALPCTSVPQSLGLVALGYDEESLIISQE